MLIEVNAAVELALIFASARLAAPVRRESLIMKPTIHVVDDDASTRRALGRLIAALGFGVETFESAQAFLDSAKIESDDCLLVDIHMPGMNGIEMCRKLEESGRQQPTILMTAHKDAGTRMLAASVHPVAMLYKPFDEGALVKAISAALNRKY